jgi:hypothetical protein
MELFHPSYMIAAKNKLTISNKWNRKYLTFPGSVENNMAGGLLNHGFINIAWQDSRDCCPKVVSIKAPPENSITS